MLLFGYGILVVETGIDEQLAPKGCDSIPDVHLSEDIQTAVAPIRKADHGRPMSTG